MKRPKLIIVGGTVATGKTSLARFLAEQTGIKRVSMDELKESMFDVGGYRDRAWSKRIGQIAWPAFKEMVEMHLERGDDVIAEATFVWAGDGQWMQELAERYGADVKQLWLTADPLVVRDRFIERANTTRHPGHCDSLEDVIEEFDSRLFNRTFIPHPCIEQTKIVDTTDFNVVDHDDILGWI